MTLADRLEQNKNQRQQAKEDGNQALLLGLLVMSGLLMVGHMAATTHQSLRTIFKNLCRRGAKELAKDDVQHVAEATGNALSDSKSNER